MNPETVETIVELERLGGRLYLDGAKVKYRPAGDPRIESIIQKLRPYREEIAQALREGRLARCGSSACAGCYTLWAGGPRIHPPKATPEWQRWRERWDKLKQ